MEIDRYAPFRKQFDGDDFAELRVERAVLHSAAEAAGLPWYADFFGRLTHLSFNAGLLRFLGPTGPLGLRDWNAPTGWKAEWPEWSARLTVFAYDWLGRQFAFDHQRVEGEPHVSMLVPGTGELLETTATLAEFVNTELTEYADASLAVTFFHEWRATGGPMPGLDECIGYQLPLFLNGGDDVSNLELTNMAMYLDISGQMHTQTKDLPEGTVITDFKSS